MPLAPMMQASPNRSTSWPENKVPTTKAADPVPRTQPYWNPRPLPEAATDRASDSGARDAVAAACAMLTPSSGSRPNAAR